MDIHSEGTAETRGAPAAGITVGGRGPGLGRALLYLGICVLPLVFAMRLEVFLWDARPSGLAYAIRYATLLGVRGILGLFYTGVMADPASGVIGTRQFQVTIFGPCSGIEGVALVAAVSAGWIVWHRRELKIGRAVLLVPCALVAVWLLNLVRVAALLAIGSAGYPAVAMGGFHSEAGWIAFNLVAVGFALLCNQFAWRATSAPAGAEALRTNGASPTAVYLLPFLSVIAASLITQAASSGFEWLYPLRLVAALAVLWIYRHEYGKVDWRFGWMGLAAGVAVFGAWIALAGRMAGAQSAAMALGLARLTAGERAAWMTARVAAAVVTVPIVEELAFRGFLARRMMGEEFERVAMRDLSWTAVLLSSLVFGLMHGRMWLAGMLAGVVFALVAKVRNRLGEAIAAHATANLLLAIWVLSRGDYRLW